MTWSQRICSPCLYRCKTLFLLLVVDVHSHSFIFPVACACCLSLCFTYVVCSLLESVVSLFVLDIHYQIMAGINKTYFKNTYQLKTIDLIKCVCAHICKSIHTKTHTHMNCSIHAAFLKVFMKTPEINVFCIQEIWR